MSKVHSYRTNNHLYPARKSVPATTLLLAAVIITGCSTRGPLEPVDAAPPAPLDVSNIPNAVPKPEPLSRYGNPVSYVVNGKRYYTMPSSNGYSERGIASWYGTKFHGKRTSSGEPYDIYAMTAAHRSLPLPTYVEVTNLQNGRSVVVKVNDRGPFHKDRIIDLSYAAAVKLGILGYGTGLVEVRAIDTSTPVASNSRASKTVPETDRHASPERPKLYLQAGAFRERRYAERLRTEIEAQKLGEVRILKPEDGSRLYKVRVGPLKDSGDMLRVSRELETLGINDSQPLVQ